MGGCVDDALLCFTLTGRGNGRIFLIFLNDFSFFNVKLQVPDFRFGGLIWYFPSL